jgi:hypothetical protein
MTTDISYGEKYAATKNLSQVEVAKLIRSDIKAGVKAGTLPKAKYSVTCDSYSGGCSIYIRVSAVEGIPVYNADRLVFEHQDPHAYCDMALYSVEMVGALKALDDIHASYNFDGSDTQSDYFHVRFYGRASLTFDPAVRAAELAAALGVVSPGVPANETAPAQNDYLAYLGAV